jgi:nucleotide-binding universal stress UspA family protein
MNAGRNENDEDYPSIFQDFHDASTFDEGLHGICGSCVASNRRPGRACRRVKFPRVRANSRCKRPRKEAVLGRDAEGETVRLSLERASTMYRKMAVAYDQSPEAKHALESAVRLAKSLGAGLEIVTVMEQLPAYTAYATAADPALSATLEQDRGRFYEQLQSGASEAAKREGVPVRLHLLEGEVVDSIVNFICREKVDLLVIGLHHQPSRVTRLWSTVFSIAQSVPCSVLGVH